MKTLLLGGNTGFWRAADRAYERDIFTGIEAWVFAFDGDHCNTLDATPELIREYDLIIGNSSGGDYRPKLLSLQALRKKGAKWVTLIEGCATDYLAPDAALKKLLDGSDLVNVINRHSLNLFRLCTTARCEYIGIPYPAATIRKQFPPGIRRDVWTPSNLYNARASFSSLLAARPVTSAQGTLIHKAFRNIHKKNHWPKILRRWQPKRKPSADSILLDSVMLHQQTSFPEYFQALSQTAFAFVNLDHRYTWARDILDCAALQIPCIATRSTGHASDYFSDLMVEDEFAVQKASELLSRLYADPEFYNHCAQVPIEFLEPLSPKTMKGTLLAALN